MGAGKIECGDIRANPRKQHRCSVDHYLLVLSVLQHGIKWTECYCMPVFLLIRRKVDTQVMQYWKRSESGANSNKPRPSVGSA